MDLHNKIQNIRGAIAPMIAILLGVLVGMAALSIDIGYALIARTELQNVADGAVLAGTRQLGLVYEGLTSAQQEGYMLSGAAESAIKNMINTVSVQNVAGGEPITIAAADIQIGQWNFDTRTFTQTNTSPDAVRVTARRDGQANGPVATFLAGTMGIDSVDVAATATAALGGLGTTDPGDVTVPIGISKAWFVEDGEYCGEDIMFHPTGTLDGCAGWHTFESQPSNVPKLRNIISDIQDNSFESPATEVGHTSYEYVGGNLASIFENPNHGNFFELYETKRVLEDPPNEWPVRVVVYDRNDCSNPNQSIAIAGYANAVITEVLGPPTQTIRARVECNQFGSGRSTGTNFGVKGTIPGLVQ
jgi:Flp pilus assembly protein TadG